MRIKTTLGKLIKILAVALFLSSVLSIVAHAESVDFQGTFVDTEDRIIIEEGEAEAVNGEEEILSIAAGRELESDDDADIGVAEPSVINRDALTENQSEANEASVDAPEAEPASTDSETPEDPVLNGFYQETLSDGRMVTVYYLNGEIVTGQKHIGDYWYMFDMSSGAMITGFYNHTTQTNPVGGPKTCYYDANGHMLYGQRHIGEYWYMFDMGSGAMARGFYNHTNRTNPFGGAKTCYYDTNGRMFYGQHHIGEYWYMFDMSSGAMVTGFYNHTSQTNPAGGPKTCYYDANGRMVYGQRTIDGTPYVFDTGSGALDIRRTYPQACAILDQVGWDLRAAYNWAASRGYDTEQGLGKTSRQYADETFRSNKGNCYGMAAVFYEMAHVLGYEVHQMSGSVPYASGGMGPHSWVEITVNGTMYVCDPEFEWSRHRNGYMIHYGQSGTFRYSDYTRMN